MLELKNLVFEVPADDGGTKRIIDDLSLTIPDDRFTVITGPNGGGKSTLGQAHHGHRGAHRAARSSSTAEDITDKSITERARLGIGYGFQQPARFQRHEGEEVARHRRRQEAAHARLQRVPLEGGPVLGELPHPRGGQVAVGRRGEAHRDRHHFGPRPDAGHLRRARGRHRFVELRQAHRDVPRHPRRPRRPLHRHHLATRSASFPAGRRDRASARRPGGRRWARPSRAACRALGFVGRSAR